jgi:hypothetical protein
MTFRQLAREILTRHTPEQAEALAERLSRALKQDPDRELSAQEEKTIRVNFAFVTKAARQSPLAEAAIKDFAVTELARRELPLN